MGKQNTTNISRQVLGFQYIKDYSRILRTNKFSVVLHEITDIATKCQLGITGFYYDTAKYEMSTVQIDSLEIPDGKALSIFDNLIAQPACLAGKENSYGKRDRICANTCYVKFGLHHSVATL